MKASFRSCWFVVVFALTLGAARGTVFEFSYTFGDGVVASGSLVGTQSGMFVEDVTGVALRFNGTPVAGTIFSATFDPATAEYLDGPVVSFDAALNNFVFSNSHLVGGDFGYDSLFYIVPLTPGSEATAVGFSLPAGLFGSQDDPIVRSRWSLAAVGVDDPGATVALLGVALAGYALFRSRRTS